MQKKEKISKSTYIFNDTERNFAFEAGLSDPLTGARYYVCHLTTEGDIYITSRGGDYVVEYKMTGRDAGIYLCRGLAKTKVKNPTAKMKAQMEYLDFGAYNVASSCIKNEEASDKMILYHSSNLVPEERFMKATVLYADFESRQAVQAEVKLLDRQERIHALPAGKKRLLQLLEDRVRE